MRRETLPAPAAELRQPNGAARAIVDRPERAIVSQRRRQPLLNAPCARAGRDEGELRRAIGPTRPIADRARHVTLAWLLHKGGLRVQLPWLPCRFKPTGGWMS
jgi:hypothetical protein